MLEIYIYTTLTLIEELSHSSCLWLHIPVTALALARPQDGSEHYTSKKPLFALFLVLVFYSLSCLNQFTVGSE